MLWSPPLGRDIASVSNPLIGRRRASGPEAEQGLKGGHRLPPAIVPEHELIQVDLELRLTDPMVPDAVYSPRLPARRE